MADDKKNQGREKLLKLVLEKLDELRANGESYRAIGALVARDHSMVHKLHKGERGEGLSVEELAYYLTKLGVKLEDILQDMTPDEAAPVLAFLADERELYTMFAAIMKEGGATRELLFDSIKSLYKLVDGRSKS